MANSKLKIIKDFFLNLLSGNDFNLSYIVEAVDWSIAWDGKQITKALNKQKLLKSRVSVCPWGLKNQIVHYGSVNVFHNFGLPSKNVKTILTWFHFVADDVSNNKIREAQERLNFVHTSCSQTRDYLIEFGIDSSKIKVIPLGVDLDLFKPVSLEVKEYLKNSFGLPKDKFIIGSFQKDGSGWGEGLEPKLIKGPDVLVKTLAILAKNYSIFVLLAGPARGYVKSNLEKLKIPFRELGNLSLSETARAYNLLDLYVVASRIEGGPKAILESMASGVPLISAKVGMAPDIKVLMPELLTTEIEDAVGLASLAGRVIGDKVFAENLAKKQRQIAENFSWDKITKQYFKQMYSKLF